MESEKSVIGFPDQSVFLDIETCWTKLSTFRKNNRSVAKFTYSAIPFSKEFSLHDIKPSDFFIDDELYKSNVLLLYNLRRGLTFISGKYTKSIIRKGLQKFFDLEPEALETHPGNKNTINYLWHPIKKHIEQGNAIEVYETRKANGENAQISFYPPLNTWCISSKNVSLLARSSEDLNNYKRRRFSYALEIAEIWFEMLNKISLDIEKVKEMFAYRTFIGEYVGSSLHQHLVKYSKKTILFYAIVNNNGNACCIDVEEAFKIFRVLNLETVSIKSCGVFSDVNELKKCLLNEYIRVSKGRVDVEDEGSVFYFVKHGDNNHTVCLTKMKTLEYRLFRKIRECLRREINNISSNLIPNISLQFTP